MNGYTECNHEGCHATAASQRGVKGTPMFRVAPKGEIGPWACREHLADERAAWSTPARSHPFGVVIPDPEAAK